MKKILCFILSAVLVFNNAIFVYADTSGTIPTPVPTLIPIPSSKIIEILAKIMHPEFGAVEDFFKKDEVKEELDKEGAITYDNDYVYINSTTVNNINNIVQDSVHALDGYYLFDSDDSIIPFDEFYNKYFLSIYSAPSDSKLTAMRNAWEKINSHTVIVSFTSSDLTILFYDPSVYNSDIPLDCNLAFYPSNNICYYKDGKSYVSNRSAGYKCLSKYPYKQDFSILYKSQFFDEYAYKKRNTTLILGDSFKYFYSQDDYKRYLNNGEQRTYAPKLPSVTIKIPVKYINNSVSLPDITYNITTENKTETEIQNQYDITIKNYLDSLDDFTDGTDPTPTPKPDGGFTDGTTPTPTPAIGDGSDGSGNSGEIIDLLKKILDKLTSFADSHSKFEKTITDYIESTDGKLDQIIEAIDSLSDGKTEDEKNGCKYDFTALSDFMTKLWNESDKKFDTMIDLLEENNKYQQKLVNSLNEIKAILITQTVLDLFTDRSSETANKAKEKFPTSLPWDIALVVNAMSAEPEQLKFTIPLKIESLNINEEINIDLTSEEWEKLAKTCRYLLSILFILFMIHLSRKLFSSGGDD